MQQAGLERLDFALSRAALGKEDRARCRRPPAACCATAGRGRGPSSASCVTDAQLIADIARGYDVVVMGADKWAQVTRPRLVRRRRAAQRRRRSRRLPRVLVVPRARFRHRRRRGPRRSTPTTPRCRRRAARAGEHHLIAPEARRRLIVDGNNVIGSRPDGWWRDRDGAARRLDRRSCRRSRAAPATGSRSCSTAARSPTSPEGVHDGVLVAYARAGGRDAADDRIVEEVERDRDPSSLIVVTSDQRPAGTGARARCARSKARRGCSASWNRERP